MIKEVPAKKIGLKPNMIKDTPSAGVIYFQAFDAGLIGAQCHNCFSIVWTESIKNSVYTEPRPASVPASGDGWIKYSNQRNTRFLESMPACPECGSQQYFYVVNNYDYGYWENGEKFDWDKIDKSLLQPLEAEKALVWLYEED